jgi:hypothetical protein
VKATTATGGSATQTWSVTPNGTVNIISVTTYWTPTGPVDIPRLWLPNLLYPAALVPQTDGSLQKLQGTQNPDSSFSIPNVPAGYYWLQLSPAALFWTSTSDFDNGHNIIGKLGGAASTQQTTTFDYAISGLVPAPLGEYVTVKTDTENLTLVPVILQPLGSSTTINANVAVPSFVDWSSVDTLYFLEYQFMNSGGFTGVALGPELTVTNVSLVDGGTNNLTATLNPSPVTSVALSIKGSQWANAMQGIGPGTPTSLFSDYAVVAQPYLTNGFVPVASDTPAFGSFALLEPQGTRFLFGPGLFCASTGLPAGLVGGNFGLPPIVSDVDYGVLSYGDPFPADWPRLFQYCQASTVSLPRPNSTVTDTFTIMNRQTTPLPTSAVSPLLVAVQNPTLNGASLFQTASLNTTNVNLRWGAPSSGQPYGYYVRVFEPSTLQPGGTPEYLGVAQYGTAKTSVQVPFLTAGNTYVFVISAEMDANANIEKSPGRTKAPNAEASVVSAPMVIAVGATAAVKR